MLYVLSLLKTNHTLEKIASTHFVKYENWEITLKIYMKKINQ